MEAYSTSNTVELTVPAKQSMLLIVRMTAAGVMSRAGLTLDTVDDLKMAVEEACNCLMMQKDSCEALKLCFERMPDEMHLTVRGVGRCQNRTLEEDDPCTQEIIRCILESMVDAVTLDEEEGGLRAIEMIKRLPPYGELQ